MLVVKIEAYKNGVHDNNCVNGVTPKTSPVPDGWVYVPESLGTMQTLENFPFGAFTYEIVNGIPTMTSWAAGAMPEPEPATDEPTTEELMDILLGVNDDE